MKHYKETLIRASKIRTLYREGFSIQKICDIEKISRGRYYDYWKMLGGITSQDKGHHYENYKD